MASIGILLTSGPFQYEHSDTVCGIAKAALEKGHEVRIFKYLDGVYNPIKHQTFPDLDVMPKDKYAELAELGAEIICCGVCVNARGLEGGKGYIDGVRVGGLPDFAEIVSEVDHLLSF
jgi:tRNA 2-thiouridine synthesizing protein D